MPDENTDAPAERADEEQPKDQGDGQRAEIPAEVKAALRKANKEAEQLRLRLREFEDRDKSEAQKLAERADAAEKRAAEHESRALRYEVAAEKGLTSRQAKRLVGTTREELEADADDLLSDLGPATRQPASFDAGARTTSRAVDMNDLLRQRVGL